MSKWPSGIGKWFHSVQSIVLRFVVPSMADEQSSPPTEMFAQGLVDLLEPVLLNCDEQVHSVLRSQAELSDQIDNLTAGTLRRPVTRMLSSLFYFFF